MVNISTAVSRSNRNPHDPRNREVVFPANDPQDGNLATPINSSGVVRAYIENLPAYRRGLTPIRRGLEIGMVHGYWLFGPFAKLNPIRDTEVANLAGLLSTVGLLVIATLGLSLYAISRPPAPTETITTPHSPDPMNHSEGWNELATGFLIGGIGGAIVAYFLVSNLPLISGALTV